jgi:hypothetical protein
MKPPFSIILIGLIALFSLASCQRKPFITAHTHTKDSIRVVEIPRIITLPGATVTQRINMDSLMLLIKNGIKPEIINRTLITTDTSNFATLKVMIDQMGNLLITCEALQREVETKDREIYQLTTQVESYQHQIKTDNAFIRTIKGIRDIVLIIVAAILLVTIINLFRK